MIRYRDFKRTYKNAISEINDGSITVMSDSLIKERDSGYPLILTISSEYKKYKSGIQFSQIIEQAADFFNVEMKRIDIDFVKMQTTETKKIRR